MKIIQTSILSRGHLLQTILQFVQVGCYSDPHGSLDFLQTKKPKLKMTSKFRYEPPKIPTTPHLLLIEAFWLFWTLDRTVLLPHADLHDVQRLALPGRGSGRRQRVLRVRVEEDRGGGCWRRTLSLRLGRVRLVPVWPPRTQYFPLEIFHDHECIILTRIPYYIFIIGVSLLEAKFPIKRRCSPKIHYSA